MQPLASAFDRLSVDASKLRLPHLKAHRFDPSAGLDPTDVAVLAVLNGPDLAAKRAAAKIVEAQSFAAGLLPDPQIALSADFPLHPVPGVTTAYNVSPSLDLIGLLTHSTALRAARASKRQADLELLWAEWATAQQARTFAITILYGEARAAVLEDILAGLGSRIAMTSQASARGDLSIAANAGDLAARLDATAQLDATHHEVEKTRGDLNALIGLDPGVQLHLVNGRSSKPMDAELDRALASLPERRPDLLALQAGREAQNAIVRRSAIARFPLINLGFSHQSDNGAIKSVGPFATLVLPIFNGGRGDMAVQTATRESLTAEYQARLDQTIADVATARRDRDSAQVALNHLRSEFPGFSDAAVKAREAERQRDIDTAALLALDQAALRAKLSIVDQEMAVALADISLATVLFLPSDESDPS